MNGCRKVMRSRRGKAAKEKGRWMEGDKAQEGCQEGGERRAKIPCRRTRWGGGGGTQQVEKVHEAFSA